MAFLGAESVLAAEASECALDQGRFWDYYHKLQAEQSGRERGTFAPANLNRFAGEVGLAAEPFSTCLASGRNRSRVLEQTEEGRRRGVSSTPTVFVNGQRLERASLEAILGMVETLTAGARPR